MATVSGTPLRTNIIEFLVCPTEISPSGTGLHIYVKSANAHSLKRMFNQSGEQKKGIEIYAGGRYSAITFNHLPGTPTKIPEVDLGNFIQWVERGDFDPDEVRIAASCKRWEQDKHVYAHAKAPLDLERWLATFHVEVLKRKPDGTLLVVCPGSHGDYDKRDRRAFLKQMPSGALAMGCLHQSCSLFNGGGNRWHEFRQLVEGARFTATREKIGQQESPSVVSSSWLFSADTFLVERLPEREVLLYDKETNAPVFYRSSINQIFAFRGQGKTVVAHAIVGAMINGGDFLRYHSNGGLRAIIVDGELPLCQLQERLKTFVGPSNDRLALMSPDRMPEKQNFPALSHPADQVLFLSQIEGYQPDVIVFDTLTRCFKFDTNDTDLCSIVNDFLLELRFRGYCVIVIHHAGKSGTQRGRTDLDDNLDISIKLTAPSYWQPGDGLEFQWDFEKVRHAGNLPGFFAKLETTGLWTIKASAHEEQVLDLLYQGKSVRSVATELDISKSAVQRIRTRAKDKGARFREKNAQNDQ